MTEIMNQTKIKSQRLNLTKSARSPIKNIFFKATKSRDLITFP